MVAAIRTIVVMVESAWTPGTPSKRAPKWAAFIASKKLGAGGMGEVFAALDTKLVRKVAIKALNPALSDKADDITARNSARNALFEEAKALARLQHENVVPVYDGGTIGEDGVYVAMEFIEGATLKDWVAERRPHWSELIGELLQVGRGSEAAHRAQLVHGNIKPQTMMVTSALRAYILDFGLVRAPDAATPRTPSSAASFLQHGQQLEDTLAATRSSGTIVFGGTPSDMAPE